MYAAGADPYCYPGTAVLKNIPGLRLQEDLDRFEAAATTQRADEPLPAGRLSVSHYYAVHRHLFQDVFAWAGKPRTVRLAKDGSAFCYPEYIQSEMRILFAGLKVARGLSGLSSAPSPPRPLRS
jgi:cell filamentation protein